MGDTTLTTALTQADSRRVYPLGLGCSNPTGAARYCASGRSRGVSKPHDRPSPSQPTGGTNAVAWAAPYPTACATLSASPIAAPVHNDVEIETAIIALPASEKLNITGLTQRSKTGGASSGPNPSSAGSRWRDNETLS